MAPLTALRVISEEVGLNRREFIKLAGLIAGTTAGVSCAKERQIYLPYVVPPEKESVPSELIYYNTTCTECPANCGISARVVEKVYNNERRLFPVKLEGNPLHPINEGKLCLRGQSSITKLYAHNGEIKRDFFDRIFERVTLQTKWTPPAGESRLTSPLIRDEKKNFKEISWEEAFERIVQSLDESKKKGLKNYYLSGRTSGTLSELIGEFCDYLNVKRLPEFEVYSYSTLREANNILFNHKSIPFYNIEEADCLLTIGADIVETFVSPVSYSNMLSKAKEKENFRWFHLEPHISLTGISSHTRFVIKPGTEKFLLIYLIKNLSTFSVSITTKLPDLSAENVSEFTGLDREKISLILNTIRKSKRTLVITGGVATGCEDGLETAVLTGIMNYLAGGTGLMDFSRAENYENVGAPADLVKFSESFKSEKAGVLFVSRTNPLKIGALSSLRNAINNSLLCVGLSEFMSETMQECNLILPLSDTLESWGDAEGRKGVKSVLQPATSPLFNTLTEGDILLKLIEKVRGRKEANNYQEYLLKNWRKRGGDEYIRKLLTDGVIIENLKETKPIINQDSAVKILKELKNTPLHTEYSLVISPSLRSYDGTRALSPLNHEIPDPITTITYGEWAGIGEETAKRVGIEDGDKVEVLSADSGLTLPAKLISGLKDGIVLVHREFANNIFSKMNNSGDFISLVGGIKIKKTGEKIEIPILSGSMEQDGRGIIPEPAHREHGDGHGPHTLYPEPEHKEYRWAMVIDLELCTGCSACVAACYIENNIPATGKKLHLQGRELSWIRIEPYFDDMEKPVLVPMLCQQCSYAPCESVCPVYATYHNPEGLNAQVYNRCVGTRYCANNCPYKVRRFNWFNFHLHGIQALKYNPDVWVRPRGVMEKCTFCIQRIRRAKDKAKDENRKVKDGEVVPACAQTCPAGAITFGNILDTESKVYKLANSGRAYRIFEELGTEPAVYYLKKEEKEKL